MRLLAYSSMAVLCAAACMSAETGSGSSPAAEATPPAKPPEPKPEPAPKAPKKVHLVWCSPGHEQFGIGMMVRASADLADGLRANGKARLADDAEVKAHKAAERPITDVD